MATRISHVPVFVDNTSYAREFKMTRFTYFYMECTEPHDTEILEEDDILPILLLDLEGIIVSGLGNRKLLNSPKRISELFDFIDEKTPYTVSAGYVWLPNSLLKNHIKRKLFRGDVVRVKSSLFLKAYANIRAPEEMDVDERSPKTRLVYFSEKETSAFEKWTAQTINRVTKRYKDQPDMNLRNR